MEQFAEKWPEESENHQAEAIFKSAFAVKRAVKKLLERGFRGDEIDIQVMNHGSSVDYYLQDESEAIEMGAIGIVVGIFIGAILGAFSGNGPIPNTGPIIAAIASAVVLGFVGGLIGGLIGLQIPKIISSHNASILKDGNILVTVRSGDFHSQIIASAIMKSAGGQEFTNRAESNLLRAN